MFSSNTFETVGFKSLSEENKTSTHKTAQTSEINLKERCDQSTETSDKNLQSESPSSSSIQEVKYDEKKLLKFLQKVTDPLLKELDKIERSKAFSLQKLYADDNFEQDVKQLYILDGHSTADIDKVRISCMSWSSTGNVIAIGFENISHEGWCTHESLINFYNISSVLFDGKTATNTIHCDSCVTSLAMHPYEPSIVAFGTHSGNIEVWSLDRSDGVCISKEFYHEDKVTQVSWANDSNQQLILVSSSLDGRICILKNVSFGSTKLLDKYVLDMESPDVLKPGVTCFSFCPQQPGTFVAGLEDGKILLCSTFGEVGTNKLNGIDKNPVLRVLDKVKGPITSIKFNPHERYIFLVTTIDFKINIYSIEKEKPISDINCDFDIIGADWNPLQKKVIIAWGINPKVFVYNQESGEKIRELYPEDGTSQNKKYYYATFNYKSPKLLALAGNEGKSYIWSVPTKIKI